MIISLLILLTSFLSSFLVDERFYYLSLMRESVEDGSSYGIHGLWPQYSKTKYPSFCKNVNFDYNMLTPILPELKEYWYSSQGSGEKFWSHEWKKHGSCMFSENNSPNCDKLFEFPKENYFWIELGGVSRGKIFRELEYFKKTLELYHRAMLIDLPNKMNCTSTCMIPVSLNFEFINQ
jgi:hypothetical protein